MNPLIIYFFVFASVSAAAALMCLLVARDESAVQVRLSELNQQSSLDAPRPKAVQRSISNTLQAAIRHIGSRLYSTGGSRTSDRLQFVRAGIYAPSAPSYLATVRLLLMTVPVAVALVSATIYKLDIRWAIIYGAPLGIAGMILPAAWLRRKVKKRQSMFRGALPDFLDVMVVCLESGMSFESALQRTTEELQEAYPVLATELGIVQREITLGKPAEAALQGFALRSGMDVLKILATNVEQSRKLGIRMADNLRTHADILRTQRENHAEEMAQKAAVKILLPTLLFIFPAIFVVLVGPAAYQIKRTFSQLDSEVVAETDSKLPTNEAFTE